MEKLDVVYIAPDIGSLFGAVSLAAGGLKVLVLRDEHAPLTIKGENGTEVSLSSEPFLWRGLRTGVFLEPLLNRLKLLISARGKVETIDPPLQVVTPEARVDLFGEDDKLLKEIRREFGPDEFRRFKTFLSVIAESFEEAYGLVGSESFPVMPLGFAEKIFRRENDISGDLREARKMTFDQVMRNSGFNEHVRLALRAILSALGLPGGGALPFSVAATVFDGARRGIFRADIEALKRLLMSTFKKRGGYTLNIRELEGVELDRNGISALKLSKSNYLTSRLYVAAESMLAPHLPPEVAPQNGTATRIHTLLMLAREEAVPVGMRDRVAVVNRNAEPLYPEHVTRISLNREKEKTDDAKVFIKVDSVSPAGIKSIEDELWEALRGVAPFVDDFVETSKYIVSDGTVRGNARTEFYELPAACVAPNLLPLECDLLAEMGLGEGIVSGRILARLVLRKLGLRADL